MNPEIEIIPFNFERDYAQAIALWQASEPGVHVGASDTPEEIRKKLAYHPELFLVARNGDTLVGTVIGGFDGRRGMIYHLAVAREYRHLGIGAQLMEAVEHGLHNLGCIRAYLLVVPGSPEVEAFYQKRGWQPMNVLTFGKNL